MKEEDKYEESLRKLKLNDSFNVPDGFFEELPGKVMDKINLAEGKTIAASNSFSTPEGYFDNLTSVIADRISERPAYTPLFKRKLVLIPLAFALLIAVFIFINQDQKTEQKFSYEDLENSTFFQSIDEDMLLDELIATENYTESNDSLTQYIIDNNVELSDLYFDLQEL